MDVGVTALWAIVSTYSQSPQGNLTLKLLFSPSQNNYQNSSRTNTLIHQQTPSKVYFFSYFETKLGKLKRIQYLSHENTSQDSY